MLKNQLSMIRAKRLSILSFQMIKPDAKKIYNFMEVKHSFLPYILAKLWFVVPKLIVELLYLGLCSAFWA